MRRRRGTRKAEGTSCWRRSGRSCISGRSCWSSRCLCPVLSRGPCPGRGCFVSCCCCCGGCASGGDFGGASGGRDRSTGTPCCPDGSPAPPCGPNGGASDGNGTLRKSSRPVGGDRTTSWSRYPPALVRIAPKSPFPCPTWGERRTVRRGAGEASRNGVAYAGRLHWDKEDNKEVHWDGMRRLGGTWGDRGGTLRDPGRPRGNGTLCIRRQWRRPQRRRRTRGACPVEGSRCPKCQCCSRCVWKKQRVRICFMAIFTKDTTKTIQSVGRFSMT